jgi:hypothetical protein
VVNLKPLPRATLHALEVVTALGREPERRPAAIVVR